MRIVPDKIDLYPVHPRTFYAPSLVDLRRPALVETPTFGSGLVALRHQSPLAIFQFPFRYTRDRSDMWSSGW